MRVIPQPCFVFMTWETKTEKLLDVCMNTFGVGTEGTFTYVPKTGSSYAVRGVFTNEYVEVNPDTHAGVMSNIPVLGIKLSDLSRYPIKGDGAIVKGVTYSIVEVEPDRQGGAKLILQKV